MKKLLLAIALGLVSVVACGDDSTTGGGGSGNGGSTGGNPSDGGAGGEAPGGAPTTGGGGSGGGEGGSGGQAPSDIVASLTEAALFGNCKPVIGPDPVSGTVTVDYDNTGITAGALNVTSVELALTGIDATLTWRFLVDPDSSGVVPAGDTAQVIHSKVADSGSGDKGVVTPCGYCSAPATVTVYFDDGQQSELDIPQFQCAF